MHPDIHLLLHHARSAELRGAAPLRTRRPRLRTRLGWAMVEVGLRLVSSSGRRRPSSGLAVRRPSPSAW
ncbi:hypothetical protein DCW30_06605 [Streptomyces alfalfae]|nr:hypothetical protein [Streptomyces alfalfae]AYA18442.1 hypothetical protein D3X13_21380 [Streptomyces fradiae]RXX46151.1 hypothetical protein DCW30_06605 [Streptomyces alfalfae]RZM92180.1 hypothetical protein D4104_21730 [Streptomyces alfalfae]